VEYSDIYDAAKTEDETSFLKILAVRLLEDDFIGYV
jgi:hypothetical protein